MHSIKIENVPSSAVKNFKKMYIIFSEKLLPNRSAKSPKSQKHYRLAKMQRRQSKKFLPNRSAKSRHHQSPKSRWHRSLKMSQILIENSLNKNAAEKTMGLQSLMASKHWRYKFLNSVT